MYLGLNNKIATISVHWSNCTLHKQQQLKDMFYYIGIPIFPLYCFVYNMDVQSLLVCVCVLVSPSIQITLLLLTELCETKLFSSGHCKYHTYTHKYTFSIVFLYMLSQIAIPSLIIVYTHTPPPHVYVGIMYFLPIILV